MDAGKEIPMRKWLTLAAAAATLALPACAGTMPASSNSSGSPGVEVFFCWEKTTKNAAGL